MSSYRDGNQFWMGKITKPLKHDNEAENPSWLLVLDFANLISSGVGV